MYVFCFDTRLGSGDIQVSKAEVEEKKDDLYRVAFDPNGGIKKKNSFVPIEEGKIYYRKFWLEDLDYDKAEEIINNYEKKKHLQKMDKKTKKVYTVKEAAIKLNKSEETIKRYIRNGELHADIHSRKQGYLISEQDILTFKGRCINFEKRYQKVLSKILLDIRRMYEAYEKELKEIEEESQ